MLGTKERIEKLDEEKSSGAGGRRNRGASQRRKFPRFLFSAEAHVSSEKHLLIPSETKKWKFMPAVVSSVRVSAVKTGDVCLVYGLWLEIQTHALLNIWHGTLSAALRGFKETLIGQITAR